MREALWLASICACWRWSPEVSIVEGLRNEAFTYNATHARHCCRHLWDQNTAVIEIAVAAGLFELWSTGLARPRCARERRERLERLPSIMSAPVTGLCDPGCLIDRENDHNYHDICRLGQVPARGVDKSHAHRCCLPAEGRPVQMCERKRTSLV